GIRRGRASAARQRPSGPSEGPPLFATESARSGPGVAPLAPPPVRATRVSAPSCQSETHWPRISVKATRRGPSQTGPSGNWRPVVRTVRFMVGRASQARGGDVNPLTRRGLPRAWGALPASVRPFATRPDGSWPRNPGPGAGTPLAVPGALMRRILALSLAQPLAVLPSGDGTDLYFARQQVSERLAQVDVPEGVKPTLGPLSTPTGEIYRYTLVGDGYTPMQLRELEDWVMERHLKQVPGVADV